MSPKPKPGTDSGLTLHKTAEGQQLVGKLPAYPRSYPRLKGHAHRSSLVTRTSNAWDMSVL